MVAAITRIKSPLDFLLNEKNRNMATKTFKPCSCKRLSRMESCELVVPAPNSGMCVCMYVCMSIRTNECSRPLTYVDGTRHFLVPDVIAERHTCRCCLYVCYLLAGWDFGYCGHYWPIIPALDDRWGWLWRNWWNEDWQGKPKYSEETCRSATLSTTKSHMTRPGFEPEPPRWKASD
jgi:hypothetical protein